METIWRNTFLIGGFFILLAALLKVVDLTLYTTPSSTPQVVASKPVVQTPKTPQTVATPRLLQKQALKIYDHNPTFGPYYAPLELVVFTNPGCTTCRAEINRAINALAPFQNKVKIIYKLLPAGAEKNDGAIFSQMALGHGVFTQFWEGLLNHGEEVNVRHLVKLLEESGVPFEKQRSAIATQIPFILSTLQKDVDQAAALGITAEKSTFFLNGYKVASPLRVEEIETYATRLLAGQPITSP